VFRPGQTIVADGGQVRVWCQPAIGSSPPIQWIGHESSAHARSHRPLLRRTVSSWPRWPAPAPTRTGSAVIWRSHTTPSALAPASSSLV